RGPHKQTGRGWRVHDGWQKRLAVMANPTPANLLQWWRELEPTLRATCLQRGQREVLIYDRSVGADAGNWRRISVPGWFCTLCQAASWDDDPRGIAHDWRSQWGRQNHADCPLLRLHLKIRAGAHQATPLPQPQAALADELQRLSDHHGQIGLNFEAKFFSALDAHHWRDSAASAGLGRVRWAACQIAQFCGV